MYNNQLPIDWTPAQCWQYPEEATFWFHGLLIVLCADLNSTSTARVVPKARMSPQCRRCALKGRMQVRLVFISPGQVCHQQPPIAH
ncbi:hypothetical protein BDW71DRAFT_170631 [Aspergillus fruticulosus]